ncbi:MAG: cytochrome c3 family protein [Candidatus Deferrimicrobiaceae bacterium]
MIQAVPPRRSGARTAAAAALALFATVLLSPAAAQEKVDQCFACHNRLGGKLGAPAKEHFRSVHREAGVACVTCHGGDSSLPTEEGMNPRRGFRGKPAARDIPQFCGRCHSDIAMMRQYNLRTDQLAEYRTSRHGRLLYEKNDTRVALCTSCHGKHEIRRKSDTNSTVYRTNVPRMCGKCHADAEYMKPYGIPTDQLAHYENGIHGQILAGKVRRENPTLAPNCATCHGIHGASPPGFGEVANVCGSCHAVVAGYYRESTHFLSAREIGEPKCITCHGNHDNRRPTIRIFSGSGPGECGFCHETGSKALRFAENVRDLLGALEGGVAEVQQELDAATGAGRNVDKLKAAYENARNRLTEVEPVFHTFSLDRVLPLIHESDTFLGEARQEIRNFREEKRQRRSVAVYSLGMLLLIAVLLGIRLAQHPKHPPGGDEKTG